MNTSAKELTTDVDRERARTLLQAYWPAEPVEVLGAPLLESIAAEFAAQRAAMADEIEALREVAKAAAASMVGGRSWADQAATDARLREALQKAGLR